VSTQAEYKFIIRFIALHRIVVCNAQVIGGRVSARGFRCIANKRMQNSPRKF